MEHSGGLPPVVSGLGARRRRAGLVGAVAGPTLFTLVVLPWRGDADLGAVLPAYFLLVVGTAVVGGLAPALTAALVSFLLANWFLTQPFNTLSVDRGDALAQLVVFVVVAVGVRHGSDPTHRITTPGGATLETWGVPSFADDLALLRSLADACERAWHEQALEREASRAAALDEADRVRTALLAAVGHDLRTPLAVIKAAVTGLRSSEGSWTDEDRDDLLATADDSVDRLTALIDNLLAMSRIEAGAVLVRLEPIALVEIVSRLLIDRPDVAIDVPDDLPLVAADEGLLERVIANLLDNATRHGGGGIEVAARERSGAIELAVIDHGPGLPPGRSAAPFAAHPGSDRAGTGAGLGLAIVGGLVDAMGCEVHVGTTSGGGTTVTVRLPVASS